MTILPQHDGAALIEPDDVERILADIDAYRGRVAIGWLDMGCSVWHSPHSNRRSLVRQEHGRTIPLADIIRPRKVE